MMPKWSRLHGACLNCGTQRRPHYSKGFCKPCHVMMKRIWAAEKWDLKHPETLTNMPSHPMWTRDAIVAGLADREWSQAEFERCRCEYIRQYRERLTSLHCSEKRRHQRVTGWDVEHALRLVHAYIRPKSAARPYHGIGRNMDDRLADEERSIIYGLLLDLIDHVPWKGIDNEEFWRRVCQIEPVSARASGDSAAPCSNEPM